jgi:hypothetical protein
MAVNIPPNSARNASHRQNAPTSDQLRLEARHRSRAFHHPQPECGAYYAVMEPLGERKGLLIGEQLSLEPRRLTRKAVPSQLA